MGIENKAKLIQPLSREMSNYRAISHIQVRSILKWITDGNTGLCATYRLELPDASALLLLITAEWKQFFYFVVLHPLESSEETGLHQVHLHLLQFTYIHCIFVAFQYSCFISFFFFNTIFFVWQWQGRAVWRGPFLRGWIDFHVNRPASMGQSPQRRTSGIYSLIVPPD